MHGAGKEVANVNEIPPAGIPPELLTFLQDHGVGPDDDDDESENMILAKPEHGPHSSKLGTGGIMLFYKICYYFFDFSFSCYNSYIFILDVYFV